MNLVINEFKFWKFRRDWESLYFYTYLLMFNIIIIFFSPRVKTDLLSLFIDAGNNIPGHI